MYLGHEDHDANEDHGELLDDKLVSLLSYMLAGGASCMKVLVLHCMLVMGLVCMLALEEDDTAQGVCNGFQNDNLVLDDEVSHDD